MGGRHRHTFSVEDDLGLHLETVAKSLQPRAEREVTQFFDCILHAELPFAY